MDQEEDKETEDHQEEDLWEIIINHIQDSILDQHKTPIINYINIMPPTFNHKITNTIITYNIINPTILHKIRGFNNKFNKRRIMVNNKCTLHNIITLIIKTNMKVNQIQCKHNNNSHLYNKICNKDNILTPQFINRKHQHGIKRNIHINIQINLIINKIAETIININSRIHIIMIQISITMVHNKILIITTMLRTTRTIKVAVSITTIKISSNSNHNKV